MTIQRKKAKLLSTIVLVCGIGVVGIGVAILLLGWFGSGTLKNAFPAFLLCFVGFILCSGSAALARAGGSGTGK